jgi:NifU-like protein involved in Fe-S cluster formation
VVGAAILGCSADQLRTARDQLRAMLKEGGPAPEAPFDGLKVLQPAAAYKNRHASILLTVEAAVEAAETARQTASA